MSTTLSQPAARFLDLLREGQPVTVKDAREYGVASPVAAARELLGAGYTLRSGVAGRVPVVVWSMPTKSEQPKPQRTCNVRRSERVVDREARIEALMADGRWRTIQDIASGIGCGETNCRIRDSLVHFRMQSDVFEFEKRACQNTTRSHWEFRIVRRAGK